MGSEAPSRLARRPLLTNSAAEFTETRLDALFGPGLSRSSDIEFMPENDRFESRDENTSLEPLQLEASASVEKFKQSLVRLGGLLKKEKVEEKLGISLKDPEKYTVQDILEITAALQARKNNDRKMGGCMNRLQNVFRAVARRGDLAKKVVSFVPNDVYGSIACGGITMILAAMEKAEGIRKELGDTLGLVPEKLWEIEETYIIHDDSDRVKLAVDAVVVALFAVLERMVDELTKGFGRKTIQALTKGGSYGVELQEATKTFESKLATLKECSRLQSERRSKEFYVATSRRLDNIEVTSSTAVQDIAKATALLRQTHMNLQNHMYYLCQSDPGYDRKVRGGPKIFNMPLKPRHHQLAMARTATRMVRDWLSGLTYDFLALVDEDLSESVTAQPLGKELSKAQWFLTSDELRKWLQSPKSKLLVAQGNTRPELVRSYLSFAAAFVATSFRQSPQCPTLYYACGFRNEADFDEDASGPMALLNTLNAQLVQWVGEHVEGVDLGFLERKKYGVKARKNLEDAVDLFQTLVELLGESTLFIVIDGCWRMSGPTADGEAVLDAILDVLGSKEIKENVVSKVLLTDLMDLLWLDDAGVKRLEIHVPDDVGTMWGADSMDGSTTRALFRARKKEEELAKSRHEADGDPFVESSTDGEAFV